MRRSLDPASQKVIILTGQPPSDLCPFKKTKDNTKYDFPAKFIAVSPTDPTWDPAFVVLQIASAIQKAENSQKWGWWCAATEDQPDLST